MLERLQKIIARAGIASRRHAEELIRSGQVRVNGTVVTELGTKADPNRDHIEAAGKKVRIAGGSAYLILNKPPQAVSTLADPEGRRTLRNFLVGVSERVFPVGRLDYNASGIVFLTSDGELASRMLKASPRLAQTYWIKVKGRLGQDALRDISRAIGGKIHPVRQPRSSGRGVPNPWYEVELAGARRDLLRRHLVKTGHPVEKMKRVRLGTLELVNVQEGHYRRLDPNEVAKLARAVDHALKNAPASPPRASASYKRERRHHRRFGK